MVIDVSVTSKHGNTALTFPHSGYFGVTPVVLAGAAHLKLHEDYQDQLPIRSVELQIRCYETLEPGGFFARSRDHVIWQAVHTLWKPKSGADEMPFPRGTWDHPFKVRIPLAAADHSSGCKSFREWRVKWRLEVLVNHAPIPHVGHRVARAWPLDLINYRSRVPASLAPAPPTEAVLGNNWAATHLFVNPPTDSYGPLDNIPVSVSVRPDDPTTSVRKVVVVLERRLELLDQGRSRRSSPLTSDDGPPHKTSRISSIFQRGQRADEPTSAASGRMITSVIAEAALDISAPNASRATWCAGSLPLPRRSHRWDIGETEQTDLVRVSFVLRVKVVVKNRKHTSVKELVTGPVPVVILAATSADRGAARQVAMVRSSETPAASNLDQPVPATDELKHKVRSNPLYMQSASSTDLAVVQSTLERRRHSPPISGSDSGASTAILVHRDDGSSRSSSQGSSISTSPTSAQYTTTLPSIRSMLRYHSPTPAPSMGADSPRSTAVLSPPATSMDDYDPRCTSTSRSDYDDGDPQHGRKLWNPPETPLSFGLPLPRPSRGDGQRLPSLDALGLGLPHVPSSRSSPPRPSTAPHPSACFSAYPSQHRPNNGRPQTSDSATTGFAFSMLPSRA